jgi:hypothetical protein
MDKIKTLEDKYNNPNTSKNVKESIKEKVKILKGNKTITK